LRVRFYSINGSIFKISSRISKKILTKREKGCIFYGFASKRGGATGNPRDWVESSLTSVHGPMQNLSKKLKRVLEEVPDLFWKE